MTEYKFNLTKLNKNKIEQHFGQSRRAGFVMYTSINGRKMIVKQCNPKRYDIEKIAYMRLRNENFLPKLIYFNDKQKMLAFTHVGTAISFFKDHHPEKYTEHQNSFREQLNDIIRIMVNKYKLYHNDIAFKNICVDKHMNIRLIDFDDCSNERKKYNNNIFELDYEKT